jgi:hypothetical protein
MDTTRERLKKKLNKKNKIQTENPDLIEPDDSGGSEPNIFDMLTQVSGLLKTNPEMINKVNQCVSKIISNSDLMTKLSTEIKNNIDKEPSIDDNNQILDNKSIIDSVEALENEFIQ